jgi:hypothetical protein
LNTDTAGGIEAGVLAVTGKRFVRRRIYSPLGETDFGAGDKAMTLIHIWTDLNISSCSEWRKRIKIHFLKSDFVRLVSETSRIRNFQYPCIITTMKHEKAPKRSRVVLLRRSIICMARYQLAMVSDAPRK